MDILERYPGRYDVLDFYGRKFAEEFAAWNLEPDSYKEELHRVMTAPARAARLGACADNALRLI